MGNGVDDDIYLVIPVTIPPRTLNHGDVEAPKHSEGNAGADHPSYGVITIGGK